MKIYKKIKIKVYKNVRCEFCGNITELQPAQLFAKCFPFNFEHFECPLCKASSPLNHDYIEDFEEIEILEDYKNK